jgi:hypothetical protein
MNDPWDQSPYWWQAVAATPSASTSKASLDGRAADQDWNPATSVRAAAPSGVSSGILALPAQPAPGLWSDPAYDKTSLLGQLPPPGRITQTILDRMYTGAEAGVGHYGTALWEVPEPSRDWPAHQWEAMRKLFRYVYALRHLARPLLSFAAILTISSEADCYA